MLPKETMEAEKFEKFCQSQHGKDREAKSSLRLSGTFAEFCVFIRLEELNFALFFSVEVG